MNILGLTKTTLLDYPGRVAATIFIGGCNFRCPFCHNRDVVFQNKSLGKISEDEVLSFLVKRKNVLSGVCISGGEPTLNCEIVEFIRKIKEIGYLVKLDTNGSRPEVLRLLTDEGLIDYCAMDIKNCEEKYAYTCGCGNEEFDILPIKESVSFLLGQDRIAYEFRTTIVRELHTPDDVRKIAKWICRTKGGYYLQPYKDCENVICPGFSGYSEDELYRMLNVCREFVANTQLRGVD